MTDKDLEELKRQWQQMSIKVDELSRANDRLADRLAGERVKSMQDRLASNIRRISMFGLLLPILAPMLYAVLHLPMWVCVAYAMFGILMMIVNRMFVRFINSSRLTELPVVDAIERAMVIKIRQQRIRWFGVCMGVAIIALLFYSLPDGNNTEILIGGAVGLLIGGAICVKQACDNARLVRRIINSLREDED